MIDAIYKYIYKAGNSCIDLAAIGWLQVGRNEYTVCKARQIMQMLRQLIRAAIGGVCSYFIQQQLNIF